MKFLVSLLICCHFLCTPSFSSRLDWRVKREIGEQTIWKYRDSKSVRATSQVQMGKGILDQMSAREKFIEGLTQKKAQGLEWLGIRDWQAKSTTWDGDELKIIGDYIDHKGERIYFEERHYFESDRRIILLLTSSDQDEVKSTRAREYFSIARAWELKK